MHDFDDNGFWDGSEIQKFYGLDDVSNKDLPQSKRDEVLTEVLKLIDKDGNGLVERDEWLQFIKADGILPDFGTGPGHHGSFEVYYHRLFNCFTGETELICFSRRSTSCIIGSSEYSTAGII